MSVFIRQNAISFQKPATQGSWVILSELEASIKAKIENVGVPLKNWNIQINYGIKTGLNEAFIIDSAKRIELLNKCPKAVEIIRPILRGRDIQKFYFTKSELYILFIPWHFPLHNDDNIKGVSIEAEKIFQTEYPEVYNHLLKYKSELEKRNKMETGIRYEWYALQRFGSSYWKDFEKPKIIYPEITKFINFTFDEKEHLFINNKCFFMTGENLEYLTCLLNSKLFRYCFLNNFPELMGGTRELRKIFLQEIRLKQISEKENIEFKKILDDIVNAKISNLNSQALEEKVNKLVYETYLLTRNEIAAIEAYNSIWSTL